jgi:hypothetical protein
MDGESAEDPLAEIRAALAAARERHAALDTEVASLHAQARPDQIRLARLKKQKLVLKDQIARLENMLTPDLIA